MRCGFGRGVAALVVGAGLLAACGGSSPASLKGVARTPPLQVASVTLPDAANSNRPFRTLPAPGHVLLVYFGYTSCPDICPTTMNDVAVALSKLTPAERARVEMAMVSVDPERDSGTILTRYLAHFFKASHALRTDDQADLLAAEKQFGVRAQIEPHTKGANNYSVAHTAMTYVVNDKGTVVDEWPFGFTTQSMTNDLKVLLQGRAA